MRDFRSKKAWSEYRAEKAKGFPYSGSAVLKLNDGYGSFRSMMDNYTSGASAFFPYWAALELIKEGNEDALKKSLSEILEKCKQNRASDIEYYKNFQRSYDTYKGYTLKWETFMPREECYNSFDVTTEKCVLPFKATEEDKKALYELIYTPFRDPYCDGRDCTGAWFTRWLNIYTAGDKTFIYHKMDCDC